MDALTAYLDETYKKIRLLRRTDKSEVWLAADRAGQPAVIKRLSLTGLPLAALQEADCPLCPKIYSYVEANGETLLVEEHIAGESLEGHELTEKDAAKLLLSISKGLALLHAHGIIHRDIKPSNLLREKSGQIRLIDFDAARLIKEESTEDTTRLGTKGYAPPEQFGYGQTDARSDIYALGMTFKRLLPEDYRGFLRPVIRKATAMDPKDRYQSAEELEQSIRHRLFLNKIKLPALGAALTANLLALGLALSPGEQEPPQTEIPAETTRPVPEHTTASQKPPEETSYPQEGQHQQLPAPPQQTALDSQAPTSPQTPATAQSPAVYQPPTTTPDIITEPPAATIPNEPSPPPPAPITPTGTLRTSLLWNGSTINEKAYPPPQITPAEWHSGTATLHVDNDSNTALPASPISINYENNYGKSRQAEALLPALAPGESADIPIPCGSAFPEGAEGLSIWVQIRLTNTILPHTENYHCLSLDVDTEK